DRGPAGGLSPGTRHGRHLRHHDDPGQLSTAGRYPGPRRARHGASGDPVIAVSRAGRRAARLILLGLPGAVVVLVLVATVTVVAVSRPPAAAGGGDWVTSWGASPQAAAPGTLAAGGFHDQTIREIVYTSAGGNLIRVRLTNAFGTSPLRIGHVTVAQAALGAAV